MTSRWWRRIKSRWQANQQALHLNYCSHRHPTLCIKLPLCLSPINEKLALSSSPLVSDVKGKVRTEASPPMSYTADLPHPSATTMGTTARTSSCAPLAIGQLKLEGPTTYSNGWKPSVRAWLVKVERWMHLIRYSLAD